MTTSVLVKDNVFPNVYDTVHVERSAFVHVAMFACVHMSPHLVHIAQPYRCSCRLKQPTLFIGGL
jgi:hypothetical protein